MYMCMCSICIHGKKKGPVIKICWQWSNLITTDRIRLSLFIESCWPLLCTLTSCACDSLHLIHWQVRPHAFITLRIAHWAGLITTECNHFTFCTAWSKRLQCKWPSRHSYRWGRICIHLRGECRRRAPAKRPEGIRCRHCSHYFLWRWHRESPD